MQLAQSSKGNPLRAKQLFVLCALEMERYRSQQLSTAGRSVAQTVESLLEHETVVMYAP